MGIRSTLAWGALAGGLVAGVSAPLPAATLSGELFRDRDGDGVRSAGEEGVAGEVEVYGVLDAGGTLDGVLAGGADGRFASAPNQLGDGTYLVRARLPNGFRVGAPRRDCPGAGLAWPVGTRRYQSPVGLVAAARGGTIVHVALGDSLAEPASGCVLRPPHDQTDYVAWLDARLTRLAPGAATTNWAVGGMEVARLLYPAGYCIPPIIQQAGGDRCDNVFDAAASLPDLVTVSIGGNDFLASMPASPEEPFDPLDYQNAVGRLVETRKSLQELLSTLATLAPQADVIVNTLYDPRARSCQSTDYQRLALPLWNQMIRDVVWGQGERFHVAEVFPEFAHQDVTGAVCCGETDRVCASDVFLGINPPIHPDVAGAAKLREKLWEAMGGVSLGPNDALGASENGDLAFPLVERLGARLPSRVEDRSGGALVDPDRALVRDDLGARLPSAAGEVRVSGFDAAPDGSVPTHLVAVVRYRIEAVPPADGEPDALVFEASLDGDFAAPDLTFTGWNTIVPLVGAGANAWRPNALEQVPVWREVRALLTRNPSDDGRVSGSYAWPQASWSDLANLSIRLRSEVRGLAADGRAIEWDAAWVEVWGHPAPPLAFEVYRAASPEDLVAPANRVASTPAPPWDDPSPPAGLLFYAVDDGSDRPGLVHLVRAGAGVRLSWP